jgi:hypothetical protein
MSSAVQKIEVTNGALTPMDMLNHAVERGAGLDVVSKLMDLQERWEKNQARKAFDAAVSDAKAEIPVIFKNKSVSFGNGKTAYRHEDLAEIARTVDPILTKHGLSYRFRTQSDAGSVAVTCILSHRDGHSEETTLSASHDGSGSKNSIQAIGSTITYLQRYTLKAALGLAASNDDDGKTAETGELISAEQLKTCKTNSPRSAASVLPRWRTSKWHPCPIWPRRITRACCRR